MAGAQSGVQRRAKTMPELRVVPRTHRASEQRKRLCARLDCSRGTADEDEDVELRMTCEVAVATESSD